MQHTMNFCPNCGAAMHLAIPQDDDRERNVCTQCDTIWYQNPRNIVGCIAEYAGKILLCKRAITPRRDFWTLPAGFMELGETMAAGAARETREEACAEAHVDALFTLIDIAYIGQAHLFYRAHLDSPDYAPGTESTTVALVHEADIPWSQLAFPSVYRTLQLYCADRAAGRFMLHEEVIQKGAWRRLGLEETPTPRLHLG